MVSLLSPVLLGTVLGTAVQLTQPRLSSGLVYGVIVLLALVLWVVSAIYWRADNRRRWVALLVAALLSLGATGLRALAFEAQGLSAALEGRDVAVTGVVAGMVDRQETGLRFRLDLEQALLDGQPVKSCSVLALQVQGRQVTTVEGLPALAHPAGSGATTPAASGAGATTGSGSALHPLQEAFMNCHGLQCGFCTPGMLMAAAGLLAHTPDPTDAQIVHALEGNLCRCTGYVNIVAAVREAAQAMRAPTAPAATLESGATA